MIDPSTFESYSSTMHATPSGLKKRHKLKTLGSHIHIHEGEMGDSDGLPLSMSRTHEFAGKGEPNGLVHLLNKQIN